MVLESTVICVDNSEFMRNGDVAPSRLQVRSRPRVAQSGAHARSTRVASQRASRAARRACGGSAFA